MQLPTLDLGLIPRPVIVVFSWERGCLARNERTARNICRLQAAGPQSIRRAVLRLVSVAHPNAQAASAAFRFFTVRSLQSLVCGSIRVMFFLILHVANHPTQIFRSEADNTIALLPVEQLTIGDFV